MDMGTITYRDYLALLESHRRYQSSPRRARKVLLFLVLEGAFVFALVITFCLFLILSPLVVIGIISLLSILFSLWRITRFRVSEDHILLDRKRYRMLYRRVNYIAHLAGAPKVSRIYISLEFNAASFTRFSLIPGLRRTTLMLGYPLLAALSRRAVNSIIAHELGHLARQHSRATVPVYATASFWEEMPIGIFAILFFPWRKNYLRRLALRLPPLRREHEMEADEFARNAFGTESQAEALGMILLREHLLEQFLDDPELDPEKLDKVDLCRVLRKQMSTPLGEEFIRTKVESFLHFRVPPGEEHPAFRDRIADFPPERLVALLTEAPCDALLKILPGGGDLEMKFQTFFETVLPETLTARRENRRKIEKAVEEWNPEVSHTPLETAGHIGHLGALERQEEAFALAEELYEANPEDSDARFCRMMALYTTPGREKEAEPLLLQLLKEDPASLQATNDLLLHYYLNFGTEEEMQSFLQLRDECTGKVAKGIARGLPKSPAELSPADLTESLKERLREALKRHKRIKRAWVVTRPVIEGSRFKMLFVILQIKVWSFEFSDDGQLKNMLNAEFADEGCTFVTVSGRYRRKLPEGSELSLTEDIAGAREGQSALPCSRDV